MSDKVFDLALDLFAFAVDNSAALPFVSKQVYYLFFAVILLHIVAALFHGLNLLDGVLERMACVHTGRGHTR